LAACYILGSHSRTPGQPGVTSPDSDDLYLVWGVLTVNEYRAEASRISERGNRRMNNPPGGLAEITALAEEVARDSYESLARLAPPSELSRLHDEMLRVTRELLRGFSPLTAAARSGLAEFARVSAEQKEPNQKLGAELERLWKQLGVPDFGRSKS
jgi:hypothetical protein